VAKERVMIFIDRGNLYAGVKFGLNLQKSVNIDSLVRKLIAGRHLVRASEIVTEGSG